MPTIDMPLLGYGTFPLRNDEATACTRMALELGYRHLDTAQMYQNEAEVGRAMVESGLAREKIFLTTKVHPDNYGERDFAPSVDRSLKALGVDQVDLLLLHWPHPSLEMRAVLDRLVATQDAGQARTIGVSNFNPDDLARAQEIAGGRIACNQIELHPFVDQRATIAAAADLGIKLTAYCPVARGKVLDDPTLAAIGGTHATGAAAIAIAWLVQHGIAAIPMSRNRERAKANLESRSIQLSDEEMRRIDAIGRIDGKMINPPGLSPIWGRAN
ncbi:MAG: aldo/keto reductase [Alphaproteobacteria bacterium]|nr:aldo/keto reductase [Alphaproteobacteria bacterium]